MIASLVAAVVCLTNEFGTVDVDTSGANVLSYVPAGEREVLFRQPEERRANKWYHGGVPVCWPWFGRYGDPGSVLHGFAWSQEWTVDAVENGKGLSRAVLRLERKDEFRLTYEVRLDRALSLRLSMQNLGREKFVVTTGLHPYFSVSHPGNITVDTPKGPIRCCEAMDGGRPFGAGTYRISDSGWSRTLELTTFGNNKLVIWSADPGENLSGLTPADRTKYICVEPAVLPRCDGFYLQPGQTYDIGMSCRVADSDETEIALPGEPCEKPAIGCAPFPDRMSAYVWRNWFVVPHARLADVVGATEADLEEIAAQMGLPKKVDVLPEWRRKGYITVLRRNWHLLDYPQLLKVVDMTREELRFSLMEDDFLFVKLGNMKPKCGELRWSEGMREEGRGKREVIARILKEEGADDFTEEPRFTFVKDLSKTSQASQTSQTSQTSPFDFRLIFSYFADYCDPLWDDEVGSYPEGLLQKLSAQGVNAVWLHTVLRTLAKDPKYPEFGEGSERRIANLNKLVKRCAKYGIRVFLYMNEPRGMPDDFFRGHPEREAFRGCDSKEWPVFAMCTSCPEVRRWVRDSLEQVFRGVPGLGGIFTITMSENLTNCASRGNENGCPRCKDRDASAIVAEINAAMIEGMHAGNPDAEALLYDWEWDRTDGGREKVMALLPKRNVRILSVSESRMPVERGGVRVKVGDYSISVVGPGESAKKTWSLAKRNGMATAAKVQANCSWEMAAFPYLPVIDLVAEHAFNLVHAGVDGVLLSWSHGCCPAPNLSVFRDIRRTDRDKGEVLDRIAADLYGAEAVPAVRRAWTTFADGYREFPFSCSVMYKGPMHMGPANPLHPEPTGYRATMVGIPYDDIRTWCAEYPEKVWMDQMAKVRDGFEGGCGLFAQAIPLMPAEKRAAAERELRLFRAATLHFRSCVDQVGFYLARDAKDVASMESIAARELATAKDLLKLVRGDSSFGFESSNQYFYIPQDIREKILTCRLFVNAVGRPQNPGKARFSVFGSAVSRVAKDRSVDLKAAVKLLKDAGIEGFDANYGDPAIPELIAAGLKPACLYGWVKFDTADFGETEAKAFVDTAVRYGARRVMVLPDSFKPEADAKERERVSVNIVNGLRRMCAYAAKKDVIVMIEDFGDRNNICSYGPTMSRVLASEKGLAYALDSGNFYYAGHGTDVVAFARQWKDRIAHVHLKDLAKEDAHSYRTLGTGAVPNAELLGLVRDLGYSAWCTIENPVGDDFLKDIVRQREFVLKCLGR